MALYEANGRFSKRLYGRRKLARQSPGNDDEVSRSILCFPHKYCTGGLVRSENEKKGISLQSIAKGAHFRKIRHRATRCEINFHFWVVLRPAGHGLYTSNLLPTPM